MKRKQKTKLSIEDLQVKSFSATLRKEHAKDALGGSTDPCNYNTEGCSDVSIWGCGTGNDSNTGLSQTACVQMCGEFTQNC